MYRFVDFGFDFTKGSYSLRSRDKPDYVTIHKPVVDSQLENHVRGKYVIAMPRFKTSNVYAFDVDNHDDNQQKTDESLNYLIAQLGKPAFIEKSTKNGGYHVYFKFKSPFLNDQLKLFERDCSSKGYKIEALTGDKSLRLPFSFDYKSLHVESLEKINNPTAMELFTLSENRDTPQILIDLKFPDKSKKYFLTPQKDKREKAIVNKFNRDFWYGCGTRHSNQFKIALFCASCRMIYPEFVELCSYYNDGTSKDMAKGMSYMDPILRRMFQDAQGKITSYIADNDSTGKADRLQIDYVLSSIEKKKLFKIFSHFSKRKNAKGKFINDCIKLYEFILSARLFRERSGYRYENRFECLTKGVPLGKELRNLIARDLRISNIDEVYRFLTINGFIKEMYMNGYSYSYKGVRFVKHFLVQTIKSIERFFEKVINTVGVYIESLIEYESISEGTVDYFYRSTRWQT